MTPPIVYKLEIDTARDGTFAQAIDDVTQYWIGQAQWNNGMAASYDEVAPPARLTAQLSNRSGDFNRDGYLSSELLVNGDFASWTADNPDSWTVLETVFASWIYQWGASGAAGTGAARFTAISGSQQASMTQTVLTVGKTYEVTIFVSYAFVGNSTALQVLNGSTVIGYLPGVGTYTFVFHATAPDFSIATLLNGGSILTEMVIDNVSLREVPLYVVMNRGMQVRLRATYNSITSTLFQGRISQAQLSAGYSTEKTVTLTVEDAMLELLDAEYAPPLLIAPTADVALQRMFDDAVIRWPYSGSYWLLGVAGNSELDYTTYLYDHDVTDFETGLTTFEYLGDVEDRGEGISAQGYVRDIIAAEAGGRFWFDTRSNKFKFTNRDHDPLNDTITGAYNESHFDSVVPKYGEDIVNDLTLTYTSRDVGAEGSVLWTLKSIPFLLKNNGKRIFNARFFDATNEQMNVGARTTVTPAAGTDYIANELSDGSGNDLSTTINVSVEASGNSAKIGVFNNSGLDVYVTLLQLRGTPVTYIEERYQTVAGDSIATNELYPKVIEIRALDNTSLAEQFGDYTVAKFKDPIFRFESATFNSLNGETMMDASVNRLMGHKITITDASTGHNRDYFIVGEQHALTIAGDHPRDVTWILKPAEREAFWVLDMVGKSELGITTRLSF